MFIWLFCMRFNDQLSMSFSFTFRSIFLTVCMNSKIILYPFEDMEFFDRV